MNENGYSFSDCSQKENAAETFVEFDSDTQENLISAFSDAELKEVLDELYADDAADIVEEMPASVVKKNS